MPVTVFVLFGLILYRDGVIPLTSKHQNGLSLGPGTTAIDPHSGFFETPISTVQPNMVGMWRDAHYDSGIDIRQKKEVG